MAYKVGDKVRIIEDLEIGGSYDEEVIISSYMIDYAGVNTEIIEDIGDGTYAVLCDNSKWNWPEKTLVPYCKTNADNIRSMTDEQLARFLVGFKNTFGEEYEGEMSCLDWLKREVEE